MAKRGYARVQSAAVSAEAWRDAAGDLAARDTRLGAVKRGVLEVLVANSTLVQELGFQKAGILKRLGELLPDEKITDLKFRVGPIE